MFPIHRLKGGLLLEAGVELLSSEEQNLSASPGEPPVNLEEIFPL
jgi:hypothetical protein